MYKDLEKPMGGLFLMTLFTVMWAVIAQNFINNRGAFITGAISGLVVVFFTYYYLLFNKFQKKLGPPPPAADPAGQKSGRRFLIIFGIEGFLILLVKNILVNINRDDLFIPCFALIVGLHFIPLAVIFKRTFDYYLAAWISAVALIGLMLLVQKKYGHDVVVASVAIGCAAATAVNGIRLIVEGNRMIKAA